MPKGLRASERSSMDRDVQVAFEARVKVTPEVYELGSFSMG